MSKLLIPVVLFAVLGAAFAYEVVRYVPVPTGPGHPNPRTGGGCVNSPITLTAPASRNGQAFSHWYYKCWPGDPGHDGKELTITIPHKACDCMGGNWSEATAWAYYGSGASVTIIAAQFPGR